VSIAAAACRRKANRDRYDERGDTLLEILFTLIVLSIAVVALIVTFETGISASVDHKSLAANDVVLRQVEEQAFYQIQQQPTPLYKSCATNDPNPVTGPYVPHITYSSLPTGYSVTMNPVQYWDTTTPPGQFDSNCPVGSTSPQLISLTLTAPNGSIATTTFVVDDLGAATSSLSCASPTPVTPSSAIQGTTNLAVTLSGTGFASGATVAFTGTGISVNGSAGSGVATFISPTQLQFNLSVAAAASIGPDTITITNPPTPTNPSGASVNCGAIFTVTGLTLTGMHVSSMTEFGFLSFLPFIGNIWPIVAVSVEDGNNKPMTHVTVTGTWSANPSGGFTTTQCETDSSGTCYILYGLLNLNKPSPPSSTYLVTGLVSPTGAAWTGTNTPSPPQITVTP
jgi:type II secretory pathway pseudopilin PulG